MVNLYRLPIKPLTTNQTVAWSKKAQRFVKTKKAKKYRDDLMWILPNIMIPTGKLTLVATFGLSNANSDTDNCIKPFQDALQTKYGFNDKRIKGYAVDCEDVKIGQEFIEFALVQKINFRDLIVLASCSN